MESVIVAVSSFVVVTLISIVGWFAQHNYKRLEADLKDERERSEIAIEKERQRTEDNVKELRRDVEADINGLGAKIGRIELDVAKEYVSSDRLAEALRPFRESLEKLEHTQRELFQRIDGKVDKE